MAPWSNAAMTAGSGEREWGVGGGGGGQHGGHSKDCNLHPNHGIDQRREGE